jgi:putative tryptophan/tyrosine transport system substrate-binding protein
MISRRTFLAAVGAGLITPLAAKAQQMGKVYRIGFLRPAPPPKAFVEAFLQGLLERGYVEGQNVVIQYRVTDGSIDQLPSLAAELVQLKVDVILASAGPAAHAAQRATTTVPVVFVGVFDPVEVGLVPNLPHPGGNVTGLSLSPTDLAGKRLELLRQVVPKLKRVAVLSHPANHPFNALQLKGAQAAAGMLGVQVQELAVRGPDDFEAAFKSARGAGALLQLDGAFLFTHRTRLADLAISSRLPAISGLKEYVEAGGLMSYGADLPDLYRRAAGYVDKILKGAKPADLPVEQPTKFEFVINLKTAKALGLTIPQSLLLRADEVIQ